MKIFETHAHLNFPQFKDDRDSLLKKCFSFGIEYIINIGLDDETSVESIKLAEKYDRVFATVGYHPHDAEKYDEAVLRKLAKHPKVVAIGETGLDFFRNHSPRDAQLKAFEAQIKLAIELDLPLVVHDRDAHDECFELLSKYNPEKVVFHCFSGDEVFAEKVTNMGWHISFTGTITYKNSNYENIVRNVANELFFIETDSPYLAPVPNRGKRNSPLNLRYVVEKIAEIKRITPKKAAEISFDNALKFFNL